MKTTYLNEFIDYSKKKVVFVPIGTIEWHGNHLPIETDFLVAQKICEILSKKTKGYVLPPIYLGTSRERIVRGRKFIGMNAALEKELKGNLYYLEPNILFALIGGLAGNLTKQGFKKIYIITGHGGVRQIEVLEKIENKYKNVIVLNPYKNLTVRAHHADENETSLFWACYPEEEARSRKIKIDAGDDFVKYQGYDVRQKASLKLGKKILSEVVNNFSKRIS